MGELREEGETRGEEKRERVRRTGEQNGETKDREEKKTNKDAEDK